MIKTRFKILRMLSALVAGTVLVGGACSSAWAEHIGAGRSEQACDTHRRPTLEERLDRAKARLEIKASQQTAWDAYAKAVMGLKEKGEKKAEANADAATLTRQRAQMAGEFAKKLARVADATEKLQAALSEDQRKILNEIVRHARHEGRRWRHEGPREGGHEWSHHEGGYGEHRYQPGAEKHGEHEMQH